MKAVNPYVEVPGDNSERIMARSGDCVGMNPTLAVWRFGFMITSEAGIAYNVAIKSTGSEEYGFLWILATRKTGKVRDSFRGFAIELPDKFRQVIDWEPS
jgi:hypothetical protein